MKYAVVKKPKWTEEIPDKSYGRYDEMIEAVKKLKSTEAVALPMNGIKKLVNFKSYIKARAKSKGCKFKLSLHLNEEDKKIYIWKTDRWK